MLTLVYQMSWYYDKYKQCTRCGNSSDVYWCKIKLHVSLWLCLLRHYITNSYFTGCRDTGSHMNWIGDYLLMHKNTLDISLWLYLLWFLNTKNYFNGCCDTGSHVTRNDVYWCTKIHYMFHCDCIYSDTITLIVVLRISWYRKSSDCWWGDLESYFTVIILYYLI